MGGMNFIFKESLKVMTCFSLCLMSGSLSAEVLTGSGDHLPIPDPNMSNPERVGPVYEGDAEAFTGTWSSPANSDWHGTFTGTGQHPGTSGPGSASFDFSGLVHGYLPVESIVSLGDLDAGSGSSESITLQAFDADLNPLSEWLNEPFGVTESALPTDMPAWEWDASTYAYIFDGSTVPGNPSIVVHMKNNQEIHFLEVTLASIGFGYAVNAPPEPQIPVELERFYIE